jgi:transposase
MATTRKVPPVDWREGRRLRAWDLHQQGWTQRRIAEALGVTQGAVSQWLKRARDRGGLDALRRRPAPGRRTLLTHDQHNHIPALLARSRGLRLWRRYLDYAASWRGAQTGVWGQGPSSPHQPPATPAGLERPEADDACQPAQPSRLPRLARAAPTGYQKKARRERRTLVWVDQAGFYLLPSVVRSYAMRGQTPILRAALEYDHLSVISALRVSGRLLVKMQERAYDGEAVVGFLRQVLRHIEGKLLIIWDGAPIHRSKAVKAFLAAGGAKRIHLEQLPGYAPDLNPDEGVWRYLKYVELKNVCCPHLAHLRHELRLAIARLRHKRDVLGGCITQCGY